MLIQPMVEKLLAMRLQGMVVALQAQQQDRAAEELSFLERLALLVGSISNGVGVRIRRSGEG
jgi:hypothetical protein